MASETVEPNHYPLEARILSVMGEGNGRPVHRLEVLAPSVAAAAIIASCIAISHKQLFWTDEIFTVLAVDDPSFEHMISGLKNEINASPPLYFILGWA